MGIFEFSEGGSTFEVDAPDGQTAMAAFQRMRSAPKTGGQMPSYDPMGNPTSGMETEIASPTMSYGKQMQNVGGMLDSGARLAANGASFGLADKFAGGMDALTGQAPSYDAGVKAQRGQTQAIRDANPALATGVEIAGGLAGGAGLVKQGLTLAGRVGTGILPRMAGFGVEGAGYGAAQAAGNTYSDNASDYLMNAGHGAAAGAAVGAAIPAVTSLASKMSQALLNYRGAGLTAEHLGVPRASVNRVATSMRNDELTPASAASRASQIGDEGMVLDMGRQLQGRAEAVASMPGPGQNRVVGAVEDRIKSTNDRVGQTLDTELGQSPDLVKLRNDIDGFYNAKAKPAYDQAMAAHPKVWDDTLQTLTKRPSIKRAINDAVELAREHGDDIASPFVKAEDGSLRLRPNVTPNLAFWDYTKKSLDARIGAMMRNPDPNSAGKATMAALLDTKRALIDHLDRLTGDAYKGARSIAADKFSVQEALDSGLDIFKNTMLPEVFKDSVSMLGKVEKGAMAAGARRALERIRENAPANMTDGGRQVYRELLQGGPTGDTAQKLRILLGDEATDRVLQTAQREAAVYQPAYAQVATNSRTTPRAEAIKDMQPLEAPTTLTSGLNSAIAAPLRAPVNALFRQGNENTRTGIADLLTRKGSERDAVVNALMNYNAARRPVMDPKMADAMSALMLNPATQNRDNHPLVQAVFGRRR